MAPKIMPAVFVALLSTRTVESYGVRIVQGDGWEPLAPTKAWETTDKADWETWRQQGDWE